MSIESITTKRVRAERLLMQYIDQLEFTDDPQQDFAKVKEFIHRRGLSDIPDVMTTAKDYFSDAMLNANVDKIYID